MSSKRVQVLRILNRIRQYVRGFRYEQEAQKFAPPSLRGKKGAAPPSLTPHPPLSSPVHPYASLSRSGRLRALYVEIAECVKCPLHQHRTQTVPGSGALDPDVMVIGEAPGANEDRYGKPFVGRAGKYLDKWLESINLHRTKNAYIANIIKCRPPNNRDPLPPEIACCKPYLMRQIAIIRPKTILIAGRIAAHHLFDTQDSLATMRQVPHTFNDIPAIVTYHPSAVLRNPNWRKAVWEDLQKLRRLIAER